MAKDTFPDFEAKYRKMFEEALDAIFVADVKTGVIIDCNHEATRLTGREKSELIGQPQSILHPPDCLEDGFSRSFKQHLQSQDCVTETKVITKAGAIRDVAIKANLVDYEGKKALVGIFRDTTDSKILENALIEEHYLFEAVTDNIGAGFVIIGRDYRVLWANKFIRDYKGDVEGKFCYATLNDLDTPCPDCGVKKVFDLGIPSDAHEYTSTDIKGNKYWVELIATPVKGKDSKVESAVEVAVDITEKKALQRKLAEYSQNLERLVDERTKELRETQARLIQSERLAAIGQLAGMVGHDLRNPLTGIKNAAYYLKKKGTSNLDPACKEMLAVIDNAVEHANQITNDLLDYSREIHLDPQPCTSKMLVDEAIAMVQFPERIQIINLTTNQSTVNADVDKIKRVFINLIKNAVDATPDQGTIKITEQQIGGTLEISFADTGTGITEEVMAKVFTPLFTTKARGMGFGLAICKRMVEAHGGRICLQSAVGEGTVATVTLPMAPTPKECSDVSVATADCILAQTDP